LGSSTDFIVLCSTAHIVFEAGKNQDGYFLEDDLLKQINHVITIFETKMNGFATGLLLFDNAPRNQK